MNASTRKSWRDNPSSVGSQLLAHGYWQEADHPDLWTNDGQVWLSTKEAHYQRYAALGMPARMTTFAPTEPLTPSEADDEGYEKGEEI